MVKDIKAPEAKIEIETQTLRPVFSTPEPQMPMPAPMHAPMMMAPPRQAPPVGPMPPGVPPGMPLPPMPPRRRTFGL
jgi:hypothetical protein